MHSQAAILDFWPKIQDGQKSKMAACECIRLFKISKNQAKNIKNNSILGFSENGQKMA